MIRFILGVVAGLIIAVSFPTIKAAFNEHVTVEITNTVDDIMCRAELFKLQKEINMCVDKGDWDTVAKLVEYRKVLKSKIN
ncbi:MAG: hypothetical protein KAS32_09660 [Candidatus Peribacteraceae bacterium]|nr:hypothetical protein [Candidatus Peribacteraceae bacterium]